MKINYIEENGDKKMTIKASNREMKSLSEVVDAVYGLVNLCDRI